MCTPNEIRRRLGALVARYASEVERLSAGTPSDGGDQPLSELTHHLGLLLAGAAPTALATVRPGVVGYGSRVVVDDLATGETTTHHVMASTAMDFEADHVSVESPLGAALLGGSPGAVVQVETPRGRRQLRIVALQSLLELLDQLDLQEDSLMAGAGR